MKTRIQYCDGVKETILHEEFLEKYKERHFEKFGEEYQIN